MSFSPARLLAAVALCVSGLGAGAGSAASPTAAPTAAPASASVAALSALGIHHVWLINIENEPYTSTFDPASGRYLATTLRQQGTLLTEYYATGHVSNDNYLAQLSGQAPNPATQSDCQDYVDFLPGLPGPQGQAVGVGCVYPASVKTLPDQLTAAGLTWRGYMEDMGNDPAREPARCGAPGNPSPPGVQDHTQSATASDQYAARHNPFVYFHSLLDSGACQADVVPLTAVGADLGSVTTTPNFSLITPNLCNDGHDATCTGVNVRGTHVGGLTAVDYWLEKYIPLIEASPAYQQDGLIIITADESEVPGDASSCCHEIPGPNSPLPGITGPGGGRVGALVLGRCVTPGGTSTVPYNHYALLRSLEDLLGLTTGGSDGQGHLGYAGQAGLSSFGRDVFAGCAP